MGEKLMNSSWFKIFLFHKILFLGKIMLFYKIQEMIFSETVTVTVTVTVSVNVAVIEWR